MNDREDFGGFWRDVRGGVAGERRRRRGARRGAPRRRRANSPAARRVSVGSRYYLLRAERGAGATTAALDTRQRARDTRRPPYILVRNRVNKSRVHSAPRTVQTRNDLCEITLHSDSITVTKGFQ